MRIDATPWARQALDDDTRARLYRQWPGARLYLTARGPAGPYAATFTPPRTTSGELSRYATGPTLQAAIDRVLA